MEKMIFYALLGYVCGSVLFANVCCRLFRKEEFLSRSKDGNPGASNAFRYGGFWCGSCTLFGDLAKGFLPVRLALSAAPLSEMDWTWAIVLAAPVLGHIFPLFFRFHGGKGIAVTFGCLLGLLPDTAVPVFLLAGFFIFFSTVLRVDPHFYRTLVTYLAVLFSLGFLRAPLPVFAGFFLIAAAVCLRLHFSREVREKVRVRFAWMP